MSRIPSLNWIRAFDAAGQHESFARAAAALNVSPAALSKQIAALETHLGARLFDRGPHSVTLTAAGRAFLPVVRESLMALEGSALSLFGTRQNRPVILRAPFVFNASWLASHLQDFRADNPDVRLHIVSGAAQEETPDEADVIEISFARVPPPDAMMLFGERITPVARAEIADRIGTPGDLISETLIEIGFHRTGWQTLLAREGLDFRLARAIHTESTQMALSLASGGAGIALARRPVSDFLQGSLGLVPCLEDCDLAGTQSFYLEDPFRKRSEPAQKTCDWIIARAAAEVTGGA
ncbi:LysR family transcriptional regulator [Salipiger mucosus]|nr:LysR family transcriptional regulator [Salipiger mucosus]